MLKKLYFVLNKFFGKKEVIFILDCLFYTGALINLLIIMFLLFDIVYEWTVYFTIEDKIRYIHIIFYLKIIVNLEFTEEENRTFIYSGTYKYDFWKLLISAILKRRGW